MKLLGIAYRQKPKAPMLTVDSIRVTKESGVVGDARGKPGKRQVTVMSLSQWREACDTLSIDLPWTARRANLLVDDYTFSAADVGRVITVGTLTLQVCRETDPCERMEKVQAGLYDALLNWRGGVCCRVLSSGDLKLGDCVLMNAIS